MSRGRRLIQNEEPPEGWVPTQAVDDPILSSPYEEPTEHWAYPQGIPSRVPGRRPASYWFKTKKTGKAQEELFAEESRDELPLINRLRKDIKRWRASGYRGASSVTKELLAWWRRDDAPRRLFFCQREAAETIIYLLELALPGRLHATGFRNFEVGPDDIMRLLRGERPDFQELTVDAEFFPRLIDVPQDASFLPLRRLGCKMATGSGKTVVMAKLITWAFTNRGRNPASAQYPNAVLICAPNLTVRERLQVLRPEHPNNYFDEFELVPPKYRELLNAGKVMVTNWHALALKNEHSEGGTSYRVVNKGEETPDAFTIDRLGELAQRLPILVLNDEGHHCWRPAQESADSKAAAKGLSAEEKKALEEDAEEARIWLAGLDRINNSGLTGAGHPSIIAAVDLSATPFYLGNSGFPEGSPFPWLVSDFGLVDAIESGIVKIPRMPVQDDQSKKDEVGRPDPKYFRLWRHVNENLKASDKSGNKRPKPEAVYREAQTALTTIASQWKQRFDEIRSASAGESFIPPVLIVVCDNTEIAQVFYEKISGERVEEIEGEKGKTEKRTVYGNSEILEDLQNTESRRRSIRIDSALLNKLETEDGQSKDQAAQALRSIIDTVGRKGKPGEHIRCVVSVGMLTEGWDATNVTHILGVRAFGSQLLCEQVVGRGLRRMSYSPDPETGKLTPEYVDVYGIPFSLIPYKGRPKDATTPDPVYHHIFAVQEREAFEIRIPVVESYTYQLTDSGIRCDVDSLEEVIINQEPTEVFVAPTRGYQDGPGDGASDGDYIRQNRYEYYRSIRPQQILFQLTKRIVADLERGASNGTTAARHQLFPEVLGIVQKYVSRKVRLKPGVDLRELGHEKYMKLVGDRIRDGILPAAASKDAPLLPIVNSYRPVITTADVNYHTSRPVVPLAKSHLNFAPFLSGWEPQAIEILENTESVEFFAPNDQRIGLAIPYQYLDQEHMYHPDFIVRMRGGKTIVVEIKGRGGEIHDEDKVKAKNAAARKWVEAVNNARRYGEWAFEICKELTSLRKTLEGCK